MRKRPPEGGLFSFPSLRKDLRALVEEAGKDSARIHLPKGGQAYRDARRGSAWRIARLTIHKANL